MSNLDELERLLEPLVSMAASGRGYEEVGEVFAARDAILAAMNNPQPLVPTAIEVEAWVAGYLAGREDDQFRTDDEIAERAVDAACAVRVDAAARARLAGEGAPR